MIRKEIQAKVEYEDDEIFVIRDINPQAPVHVLILPKIHIEKIGDIEAKHIPLMGNTILRAKQLAAQKGWKDYRLVFNNGPESGQSVFHIHLHLLSGRRMTWPPG